MFPAAAQPVHPVAQHNYCFLLLPSFSPFELSSAVAALDAANRVDGTLRYAWRTVSESGLPVRATNGLTIGVDGGLDPVRRDETVIVCGGAGLSQDCSQPVLGWLRKAARRGCTLGALSGGTYALAVAGLLSERRVTTHWSLRSATREICPDVELEGSIYTIEDKRITCAGGAAVLDMMLQLVSKQHGVEVATAVSDRLIYTVPRSADSTQTISDHCRTGVRHEKLSAALRIMRAELEDPWTPSQIAEQVGLSTRQLERLFSKYLNATPKVFYTRLRLENARSMLQQTDMKIIEVGLANGFTSQSHFSRVYRKVFGISPNAERGFA
ncbi:MAG: helix-turn-helix domain-containing protein [Rhodobacteraceae bacterium]|nr:helix-turn-helix domain-containing protein [Paracoccaceae bacterium]